MLNVLIVDDEYVVLEGLSKKIKWGDYNCEVIGLAENGLQAIEFYDQFTPDLILTDICMPGMDGLDFIKYVKEKKEDTYCIVFSGYNEFEYVKKAIQLGASDYLEKPITVRSINEALEKAQYYFEKKHHVEKIQSEYEHSKFVMIREAIHKLIQGKELEPQIQEELHSEQYTVIVSSALLQESVVEGLNIISIELENCFVSLLMHQSLEYQEIKDIFSLLDLKDIVIGIGKSYESLQSIVISYGEAQKAFRCAKYFNRNQIIHYEDLQEMFTYHSVITEYEEKVVFCLLSGNFIEALEAVEQFLEWLHSHEFDPEVVESELVKLLYVAMSVVKNSIKDEVQTNKIIPYVEIKSFENKFTLLMWYKEQFNQLISPLIQIKENSQTILIERACAFIEKHISQDLSLHTVANHLKLSPSYLSLLFKEVTGVTYIKYVTTLRIEKAKRLLLQGMKVAEISDRVGYLTYRHFVEVFKKQTGYTPAQYKQKYFALIHHKKTDVN